MRRHLILDSILDEMDYRRRSGGGYWMMLKIKDAKHKIEKSNEKIQKTNDKINALCKEFGISREEKEKEWNKQNALKSIETLFAKIASEQPLIKEQEKIIEEQTAKANKYGYKID